MTTVNWRCSSIYQFIHPLYSFFKAARELAEIRDALRTLQASYYPSTMVQSLPLPPIPPPPPPERSATYQPASLSSCSTENKYETIGKSISPYKKGHDGQAAEEEGGSKPPPSKHTRKSGLVTSLIKSSSHKANRSGSSNSDDSAYGFSTSTASPVSLPTQSTSR